ncbi:MAG: thiamine phosphate synthase [Christensenellales bacterium]|nr:thiamine phosphate synthase [Christensenellales bacterium]
MTWKNEWLRLYAVTDRSWLRGCTLMEQVEQALSGGATMVQLREKHMDADSLVRKAAEMTRLCHRYGVPLLINDDVEAVRRSGADGVHVGQSDMEAAAVRGVLGSGMIVGVTAKTVEQALAAQAAGADYLGSGAVFGSSTKTDAKPMTRETLQAICRAVSIPVVAIGGIGRSNIMELAGTDIAGVAVVSGIFASEDIAAECRFLRQAAENIALHR